MTNEFRRKMEKCNVHHCGANRAPLLPTLSACVFYQLLPVIGNVANFHPAMKYQQICLVITDFFKDEASIDMTDCQRLGNF